MGRYYLKVLFVSTLIHMGTKSYTLMGKHSIVRHLHSPWQNGSVRDSEAAGRGFAPRHGLRLL
ncbi:hypothetical protein SK128_012555 [Halocaridina rubra]|uniref:Uncharacterized protein n=1 Tax=Halocaridina rubra TaxID=373956 RepID=A0AAN8X8N0_HALRR